eukprot:CAMPEP_0195509208 /NCGR_PEP_ID=MMETSP0794_2-20130614/2215_1 /TAXON_ID=515487 /ORGANISM="Stephanopyxis turris, Strain CCMP 815" /LENGTH=291 /DNA_ID=CAMNT_0040636373 /DNA_START=42 /DNA_END=917 /DNA_ORIENTATION=+
MSSSLPNDVSLEEDESSCQSFYDPIVSTSPLRKSHELAARVDTTSITPPQPQPKQNKIDTFLSLYCKWTASSTLSERGIKMAQWTVWLLSQLSKNKNKVLSSSLRKLYSDLSMMRYVLRLYGMPVAIEGVRSGSWSGGKWKDSRIHKLSTLMAWSMVLYHPLEHLAWAQWTMPKLIPKSRVDGNRLSAWSCRFWAVYIVADFYGSILKNRELEEEKCAKQQDADPEQQAIEKTMFMNKLQIVRNIFYIAPCINWALDDWATNPWLSENWCNGLSLAEAITCMYQSIYPLGD